MPRGPRRPGAHSLTIPPLFSGLVPLELSAGGRRLLAVFTGQDAAAGFTVDAQSGRSRAISRDFEAGLVGFDISADGRSILAHTGGPDPAGSHDVVRVPLGRRADDAGGGRRLPGLEPVTAEAAPGVRRAELVR